MECAAYMVVWYPQCCRQVRLLQCEVQELSGLNATLTDQLEDMHAENSNMSTQLSLLSGNTLDTFTTVKECEQLERRLQDIVKRVQDKKVSVYMSHGMLCCVCCEWRAV